MKGPKRVLTNSSSMRELVLTLVEPSRRLETFLTVLVSHSTSDPAKPAGQCSTSSSSSSSSSSSQRLLILHLHFFQEHLASRPAVCANSSLSHLLLSPSPLSHCSVRSPKRRTESNFNIGHRKTSMHPLLALKFLLFWAKTKI